MSAHDQETRTRLLEAATELFAQRGFHHVTVRQICVRAQANVAAINYHFGDKLGLYVEILKSAMAAAESAMAEAPPMPPGAGAEQRLRLHVEGYITHLLARGQDSAVYRMMVFENAEPTPALDMVVEQGIAKHFALLAQLVAEILDTSLEDPRVARAVIDIRAVCLAYLPSEVSARMRRHLPYYWSYSGKPDLEALANELGRVALAIVHAV